MGISSALGSSALLPAGLGFRNMLINGDMRIAQRNTSVSGITTSDYRTVDRWYLNLSSAGTWTMAQTTDAPTSEGFGYSVKLTCTTAQASPATTNNARFWQKLEGFNVAGLAKGTSAPKPVVLSFWVKSGLTGTFICTLDDLDNSRKISASYTISTANVWEKKTLSFVGDTTGTFTIDNSESLMVTWWLMAGPSFQGSSLSTSWSSASTLTDYANGQTNVAAGNNSAVNYWQITGVQLEQNYQPTPFEQRPYGVELQLCQRYYQRFTGAGAYSRFGMGVAELSTISYALVPLWVEPRTVDTSQWTLSYSAIGTSGNRLVLSDGQAITNLTGLSVGSTSSSRNLAVYCSTASGLTTLRVYYLEETSTGNEWLAVSMEL